MPPALCGRQAGARSLRLARRGARGPRRLQPADRRSPSSTSPTSRKPQRRPATRHLDARRGAAPNGRRPAPSSSPRADRGRARRASRRRTSASSCESSACTEPGLDRLIRAAYDLLGLQTYFTAGPKEVARLDHPRAATSAPQAAGVIHTDFERGFIRAETIAYDDYVRARRREGGQGSRQGARRRQGIRRAGRRRHALQVQRLIDPAERTNFHLRPGCPARLHSPPRRSLDASAFLRRFRRRRRLSPPRARHHRSRGDCLRAGVRPAAFPCRCGGAG